jgi:hypothetical protein
MGVNLVNIMKSNVQAIIAKTPRCAFCNHAVQLKYGSYRYNDDKMFVCNTCLPPKVKLDFFGGRMVEVRQEKVQRSNYKPTKTRYKIQLTDISNGQL